MDARVEGPSDQAILAALLIVDLNGAQYGTRPHAVKRRQTA
jgi:hypothetical protein